PRHARRSHAYRDSHTDTSDGMAATDVIKIGSRAAQHRRQEVPVRGRLMVAAMAVGATAAGAYTMANATQESSSQTVLAADQAALANPISGSTDGMQIVAVTPAASSAVHT